MNNLISVIKNWFVKTYNKIAGFIPTHLPVGMVEFEVWSKKVIKTYDLPDNDSSKFALATMILHAASTEAKKAARYFGLSARKSMANQVAAQVMQDLKIKQAEAQAAAKLAATTIEVTASVESTAK